MTDVTKKDKLSLSDGGELICILTVPVCEKFPQINDFYTKVQELCHTFCTQKLPSLLPSAKNTYRYRLSCKLCEKGENITVTLSVALSDLTERKMFQKHSETHLWQNGMLKKRKVK